MSRWMVPFTTTRRILSVNIIMDVSITTSDLLIAETSATRPSAEETLGILPILWTLFVVCVVFVSKVSLVSFSTSIFSFLLLVTIASFFGMFSVIILPIASTCGKPRVTETSPTITLHWRCK